MSPSIEDLCLEAERGDKEHKLAAKLVRLADRFVMRPGDVVLHPNILAEAKLKQAKMTTRVVDIANSIERQWGLQLRMFLEEWPGNKVEVPPPAPAVVAPVVRGGVPKPGKRTALLGRHATAVIRWMGVEGWSFEEAKRTLRRLGVPVADATIRIQLRAGAKKDADRGPPAELTTEEGNALYDAMASSAEPEVDVE